jgi:hypothetical protein
MSTVDHAAQTEPTKRPRSRLLAVGDAAMRDELRVSLQRNAWNLTHTAEDVGLADAGNVLRMIRRLGLMGEYNAVRASRIGLTVQV